jgi:hypothetical protein
MARKQDLGTRGAQLGISDANTAAGGGFNPYLPGTGWDVVFQPADLNIQPDSEVQVWHIALDGPVGSVGTMFRDGKELSYFDGWANDFDPSQPLILIGGQSVQFAWNFAFTAGPYNRTSNVQPRVTLWLRLPELSLL